MRLNRKEREKYSDHRNTFLMGKPEKQSKSRRQMRFSSGVNTKEMEMKIQVAYTKLRRKQKIRWKLCGGACSKDPGFEVQMDER